MASLALQKSTIVRLLRAGFGLAELLAPRVGARVAERIWFTLPAAPRRRPLPACGTGFEVRSQAAVVRGRSWGEGPVVYLVHGWGGRGGQLAAYVEPLVRRGHRVVLFDGLSHGDSDAGPSGPRSSNAVELGRALDDVAARFGPAHAVVAHSMGAAATALALKYGWLGTDRLALVAPLTRLDTLFDGFGRLLGFGPRTRGQLEARSARRVGLPVAELDLEVLLREVGAPPPLVVHDRHDPETSYAESAALVAGLPGARLHTTEGLGHRRVLRDAAAVQAVVDHVTAGERQEALPASA